MNKTLIKLVLSRIGYSNVVLIVNGKNSILIDTGVRRYAKKIRILFNQFGLKPTDIKLIILTHVHYDHTGNLHEISKISGANVLVHKNEFENLKKGFIPIPNGLGKYSGPISKFGKIVYPKFASPRAFVAGLVNTDEFDLQNFGIDGKVISTPGHTSGSQSVIIGKTIISGDTFVNLKNGKIFPPFCNDPKTLLKTWEKIFDLGIEDIYPGHGKKLKISTVIPEYEKWKKRLELKD